MKCPGRSPSQEGNCRRQAYWFGAKVDQIESSLMTLDALRKSFLLFGATQCAGHSPLYERLAIGIADDELLLELVLSAAPSQQRPTLLFAAVHELVVQERRHPLAMYYASVTAQVADDDPLPAFRDFCSTYREQILGRLRTGGTRRTTSGAAPHSRSGSVVYRPNYRNHWCSSSWAPVPGYFSCSTGTGSMWVDMSSGQRIPRLTYPSPPMSR